MQSNRIRYSNTQIGSGAQRFLLELVPPGSDLKSSLAYPNGLTASWQYDANNQLLQVRNATPTNVISQFDYTYDAAGRRTAIAKSGSSFGDLSGSVDTYTYNARSGTQIRTLRQSTKISVEIYSC